MFRTWMAIIAVAENLKASISTRHTGLGSREFLCSSEGHTRFPFMDASPDKIGADKIIYPEQSMELRGEILCPADIWMCLNFPSEFSIQSFAIPESWIGKVS